MKLTPTGEGEGLEDKEVEFWSFHNKGFSQSHRVLELDGLSELKDDVIGPELHSPPSTLLDACGGGNFR